MKAPETKARNENIAAICARFNRLHIARICGPESDVRMTRMATLRSRSLARSASLLNNSRWRCARGAYVLEPGAIHNLFFLYLEGERGRAR